MESSSNTPQAFDTLWVIEAPGKVQMMEATLRKLGYDARVVATKGHFMKMPDGLQLSGINSQFIEVDRAPANPDLVRRLVSMASAARQVVIATDADREGDVIAWDVASVLRRVRTEPLRVRLKALDEESVREALSEAGPVRKEDAIPGRTRAIIDRLIGSAHMETGIGAGRISSAILSVVMKRKPHIEVLTLTARARDKGAPWKARTPVKPPLTGDIARSLGGLFFPSLDFKSSTHLTFAPNHLGDIMMRSSEVLGLKPSETARAMQASYESGRLSYPRSGSRGMSRGAARKIERILKKAGQRFSEKSVPDKEGTDIHDAPYPVGHVDVSLNPARMGEAEGVRTLIARDLVRTGQEHRRETPDTSVIRKFLLESGYTQDIADLIAKLDWHRDVGPNYPGKETWPEPGVTRRAPEAAILEACMAAHLGKPSTWASHIDRFMERELVDPETMELTAKGQDWAARTPGYLLNPKLSKAIEDVCEKGQSITIRTADGQEPWEALAERIIASMPEEMRNNIVRKLEDRERIDSPAAIPDALDMVARKRLNGLLG